MPGTACFYENRGRSVVMQLYARMTMNANRVGAQTGFSKVQSAEVTDICEVFHIKFHHGQFI